MIEIVSPESRVRDRHIKYGEYAAASVPEYWLIDPLAHTVEVFWLATPGEYQRIEADDAGRLRSRVLPGFWLQPSWLWMEPLPSAADKLAAIAGRAM